MTLDPVCNRADCKAPNHCHVCGTHHAVDSLARQHEERERG